MHRSVIARGVSLATALLLASGCAGPEPEQPTPGPETPSPTPGTPTPGPESPSPTPASPTPTEEPDPTACPPPEVEATYLPPGVHPDEPRQGLGGGAGGTQEFPNAIHYGDSPGPDGEPAPFINIVRTTEHGGPHIPAAHAQESGTPVEVLGGEGHLVPIEGGWGAFFLHGDDPCNGYEVTGYDVSEEELRRFLDGLEEDATGSAGRGYLRSS